MLEGLRDLHLLISRPRVYPIVAQKPRREIKACVIQWLLYHPTPALPLRGLLLQRRQQQGREGTPSTDLVLSTSATFMAFFSQDLISLPLLLPQRRRHRQQHQLLLTHLHSTLHGLNFHLTILAMFFPWIIELHIHAQKRETRCEDWKVDQSHRS